MIDVSGIVLTALAAVALFLFGVSVLSDALETVAGDRMRRWLERSTRNVFAAVLTGIVVTAVLDSSSAVIILVIALISARLLDFERALGVILGANIGTTISSQLIAFQIGEYAAVPLAVGVVGTMIAKSEPRRAAFRAVLALGMVFFGLSLLDDAVRPLRDAPAVLETLARLESPPAGVLAGALVTLLVQSSSATVAIAISLGREGVLSLAAGVAVMLGAEIGTCADTLVATAGRSRAALRAGLFHLGFNVATVIVGVLALPLLVGAAQALDPGDSVGRRIANAHVLFNVVGVMIGVFLVGPSARLLRWLVPDRAEDRAADRAADRGADRTARPPVTRPAQP